MGSNILQNYPELANYVRYHPIWYRYLSREPHRIYELAEEAKVYYGRTLHQRLEKINEQVNMAHLLIQIAGTMKD